MKGTLFFCSIVVLATAKPGGYYHQEYNYKSSSSSYKNNELQHQNEDQGFYSKDGDLEGRLKPKVNSHNQHSEYTNPKLLNGASTSVGSGYHGSSMDQASFDRLLGNNMNGYRTDGATDGYASADRVMDLSNVYSSGSHGTSHGSYGASMRYGSNSGGYGSNSLGYGRSSDGYTDTSGNYGSRMGSYGRTHESIGTSRNDNYGNSLGGNSNYRYTQGGSSYIQRGSSSSGYSSSNANLNSIVQRLQDDMSRQLQNAVNNQYRSSGYTTTVSSSQLTADIRTLEDELKRNLTRQLEESLRNQYGTQELRGSDYYSVTPARQSNVANYRNQELADLTGQLEDNLLKQLHQSIRTTYNRQSGSTYTSSGNLYQPTYVSSTTYRPSYYERTAVVIPSNVRYTPIPNPDSITQIASRIQSDINLYLDDALQNIYSTYIQNGRNSYTLTDFDNEVNRIRDQIISNLTWNLDDQIRRNYGQQILKDDHYYSVSSTGQTSSLHNYNIRDYENLKKQVEDNLLKKLNQTVTTYREQYQRQQSYSTNSNYYTATFRPVYYTSGNQVYDYSDLQRQLSEQLQNALNKHRYSQSSSYSMSTSNNPQAYQTSLDELTRELQRNLTEQLNNYRVHSSSSSYGYSSSSNVGGGSADFESMKNQLQNQLMQQLQQGLQKQYRYSASALYSASSSSSSNANYGTHQSYGNYGNMYPHSRYKRDTSMYVPTGHHISYNSAKSSRTYSSSSHFSSEEDNRGTGFLHHTRDLKPLDFGDSINYHGTSGSHFGPTYEGSDEDFPEVVEDVTNHHQVERPQKLYMPGYHQRTVGSPEHNRRFHHEGPEFNHKFRRERFRASHDSQFPAVDIDQQQLETADSHFKFTHKNQLPEEQSQDQQLGIKHPVQIQSGNFPEHFTRNHQLSLQQSQESFHQEFQHSKQQVPEQQYQEDLHQNLKFQHPQRSQLPEQQYQEELHQNLIFQHQHQSHVPEQQSQEDLHQKLEFQHPQQSQLPEQQYQEDLHQKIEFQHQNQLQTDHSKKQFEFTSNHHLNEQQSQEDLHQPDQHLEDQDMLTQQLEQEPQLKQKVQKPDSTLENQQQIEDIDSLKPEAFNQQQVDDQNQLPEDLEQQQLEQDDIPKPLRDHHSELTRHFNESPDNLTQQLEQEPKYIPKTNDLPIEDLPSQQLEVSHNQKPSNQQSQKQKDLTQQQIQDDLSQKTLENGPNFTQNQEIEQQVETDAKNVIVPEKFNQQPEQLLENQNELTQQQELEQQLETDNKNIIVPEKINQQPEQELENQKDLTHEQELEQQLETELNNKVKLNQISEQQLEDQNDLTQKLEVDVKQQKTYLPEADLDQQLELEKKTKVPEQNLISEHHLEGEPSLTNPKKKSNYHQSQIEQSENDMKLQLFLDNKPNQRNIQEQEQTGQTEDDLNQKLEQQVNQEFEDQDNTQQQETKQSLEPLDQKLNQKHQDQAENDLSQELELTRPNKLKKHPYIRQLENDLDQKLELSPSQKTNQLDQHVLNQEDLVSKPKDSTHIQDQQTEDQSTENALTQQLETDDIEIHKKPNYGSNFNQELENNNDQQLELAGIHKTSISINNNNQQQTQLKLTDVKIESDEQKQQTDQSIDGVPQHSINHLESPTTITYQRPESHVYTYQHNERTFTNSHTGYATRTDSDYEESLRQQAALLDLLKQKVERQPDSPSMYGQKIIKKTTYVSGNPVNTFDNSHYTKSNGEIENSDTTSIDGNTFPKSHMPGQSGLYGYGGTSSSKTKKTVVHFVNGKPVSATEYIRIVKPNGQVVESKHEMPLTPDLLEHFTHASTPNHMAATTRTNLHFVGSNHDIPSSENLHRQYSGESSHQHPTGHYGVHQTENFPRKNPFPHQLSSSQLVQNMENQYHVDGLRRVNQFDNVVGGEHDISSMGDLLRQNEFSHRTSQFSHNINNQPGGFDVGTGSIHLNINSLDDSLKTSGFSGQSTKKMSYYVNGKLVSSSESHQRIGPDGRIIEMETGSHPPSALRSVEQQLADLQSAYPRESSENNSRYSVKTSRYSRIGY